MGIPWLYSWGSHEYMLINNVVTLQTNHWLKNFIFIYCCSVNRYIIRLLLIHTVSSSVKAPIESKLLILQANEVVPRGQLQRAFREWYWVDNHPQACTGEVHSILIYVRCGYIWGFHLLEQHSSPAINLRRSNISLAAEARTRRCYSTIWETKNSIQFSSGFLVSTPPITFSLGPQFSAPKIGRANIFY